MKALTPEQHAELIKLHNMGWSYAALAKKFNISKTSVFFYYHSTPILDQITEVTNGKSTNELQTSSVSIN